MTSRYVEEAGTCNKAVEAWAAVDIHILIIAVHLNVNSWSGRFFKEFINLLALVQGVLMDELGLPGGYIQHIRGDLTDGAGNDGPGVGESSDNGMALAWPTVDWREGEVTLGFGLEPASPEA